MTDTPARLGYRMPAEWDPHAATWVAWPHNRDDWPGKFGPIPWVYVEIVRHLHRVERVRILAQDARTERRASSLLVRGGVDLSRVDFFRFPTDRAWTRDFGPIFVKRDGEVAATNWGFNAWAKYPDWRRDDRVPDLIGRALRLREWRPTAMVKGRRRRVALEGGSVDVNGRGTLLTTEECLLSPVQARNPGLTRRGVERVLADYLGVRKTLWLRRGIVGDDTHGHVDDLARFANPTTVVIASEDDPADENYEPLRENLRLLRGMTDQDGRRLRVVTLPMPDPVVFDGQRLPASYANFYVANGLVLAPTFNDAKDRVALSVLAGLFPGRRVVGIHAVDLVWGLGTLHCMTQQEPA
ncbi:MAG: agmatine deiminase [Candidatus Handelsmanbacteria bacterium RIFCSPLOWO2_12_FULL_64_10]|uniref:Agmatine deiminase n=1 Tax=Handelsmanbacteria sp. (strain RIFCSPLOWO2_12_FULL_64_10) TaxID=1817868 RepID=A0A1F6CQL8_HANXR|nr:MAG: agmatine deiminase [Candidatus Handelsmanbacteria bacterium RIFCSPLOWO2_12_FULL_64_10]